EAVKSAVAFAIAVLQVPPAVSPDRVLERRNAKPCGALVRPGPCPRRVAPPQGVTPHWAQRGAAGDRPPCRERASGAARTLAGHRPEAVRGRPCLRRDAAFVELPGAIALCPPRDHLPFRGPPGRGSRARSPMDVRQGGGGAARIVEG